ncbi:hypothetical protein AB838_08410 [Rhodobacteraceae bacterium (ex Bugula neritina AB1)]|nr:hypothetical protein AB838_08410 [Rhodobacteraceae bacterium (ex Bugula neritina AB1)]
MTLSLACRRGLKAKPQFVEAGRGELRKMKFPNIRMAPVRQDRPHGRFEEILGRPYREVGIIGQCLLDPLDMRL